MVKILGPSTVSPNILVTSHMVKQRPLKITSTSVKLPLLLHTFSTSYTCARARERIHTHTRAHTLAHTNAHKRRYIILIHTLKHIIYECVCLHIHTYNIYTYIHTHTHTHTHTCLCVHTYIHTNIYIYIYIHICVYLSVYVGT